MKLFHLTSSLSQLRLLGLIAALSGIGALTALALTHSALLFAIAAGVMIIAGYGVIVWADRVARQLNETTAATGRFMRGAMDVRVLNIKGLDALGRLQHRVNNLLDLVDLATRGAYSAVETGDDADYLVKLRQAELFDKLTERQQSAVQVQSHVTVAAPIPAAIDLSSYREEAVELEQELNQLLEAMNRPGTRQERSAPNGAALEQVNRAGDTIDRIRAIITDLVKAHGQLGTLNSQLNLVAINGAIEASRGGQEFAGYAMEMKSAVEEAGQWQEEMAAQIRALQAATHTATTALEELTPLLERKEEPPGLLEGREQSQRIDQAKRALVAAIALRQRLTVKSSSQDMNHAA